MKVIGVFNVKGGVGKTTTAVNLAYLASRSYARTLLWDLDPQAAATFYFRVKPKVKGGISRLLDPKRNVDKRIKGTDFDNLDLLPADLSYRNIDLLLDELKKPTRGLRRVLKPLRGDYEYVFLDCPPSLSLLSENIMRVADVLLVPTIPSPLSVRTLEQVYQFSSDEGSKAKILPFFSMADRRKKLHKDIMESLPERFPDFLDVSIPYAATVEQMGLHRAPVATYARWTKGAEAFERLWRATRRHLDDD